MTYSEIDRVIVHAADMPSLQVRNFGAAGPEQVAVLMI